MDVDRLNKDELIYELRIRGLAEDASVDEMRRKLRPRIRLEREGKASLPLVETTSPKELEVCQIKVDNLEAKITALEATSTEGELRKIDTGLQHVTNRINRVRPEVKNVEACELKKQLTDKCALLWAQFEEKTAKEPQQIERPVQESTTQELDQYKRMLDSLKMQMAHFSGSRESPIARHLDSLIADLLSKLTLMSLGDTHKEKLRIEYLQHTVGCLQELNQRCQALPAPNIPPADSNPIPQRPPSEGYFVKKVQVPLKDWGIKFSGDGQGLSVHAFLEAIDEMKTARNASEADLYNSAYDLFTGRALIWYKAIRRETSNWGQIVREMRNEFEPQDYAERLWDEIRSRTQGEDEPIGIYVSVMRNYFHRLPQRPAGQEMLRIVMRNLHPYYLDRLGLQEVSDLNDLVQQGRRLEQNRWRIQTHRPPPPKKYLLEPDLAYLPPMRRNNATVAEVRSEEPSCSQKPSSAPTAKINPRSRSKCWNCGQPGHAFRWCRAEKKLFCERCGKKQVTTEECSCSRDQGNSPRGRV